MLSRMDMHMGLVNSAALRLATLDDSTESPPGGRVDKDSHGRLTGMLADHAMTLVSRHIPKQTHEDKHRALHIAASHLLSKGVTTACDMGAVQDSADAWDSLEEVYMVAADQGSLPMRVVAMVPLPTWRLLHTRVQQWGRSHPGGRLYWGGLKDFADGSLGSQTALMHLPYANDPSSTGIRLTSQETLQELVAAADTAGLQVAIHAIGDRANDEVIALYQSLPAEHILSSNSNTTDGSGSLATRRHRIEHVQHLSGPSAIAALRDADVVAVTNPLHLLSDLDIIEAKLGQDRAKPGLAFPSKALLQAGVAVAFGSDWPVMPAEPLATMHTAANSDNLTLPSGALWGPGASVSPEGALLSHTVGGAVACDLESEVGMLRPGMRADFTVYQHSLLHSLVGDAALLPEVTATFVDGACAFGCSNFLSAPVAATATAARQDSMTYGLTANSSVDLA
ncbi:hypothetical protein ABBQ32_005616 [Trebouxia sp. C0010 RCD-2024]